VTLESVTIEGVNTAATVMLTTNDIPPSITIPPSFTLPQNVVGTTLSVDVTAFSSTAGTVELTGDVGVYGVSGTLALVGVQNLEYQGFTFNVGAAVLSLGGQATGSGLAESFTPSFAPPCFATGTMIATDSGAQAVETLAVGQVLRLATGETAAVRWLGHRDVDCARHPCPQEVWPVCISADAIAPGLPARDLWLSPDHAIALDGALVPVRYLVNGATIRQVPRARVGYWHVELDAHALLLAEGLAAESYLDTGNRGAFANAPEGVVQAHPAFATADALAAWHARACLPLLLDGDALTQRRRALLARAAALGWRTTTAPSLRAEIDSRPALLLRQRDGWSLRLPAGARTVRLLSHSFVPAEHDPAPCGDTRRLGVALALERDGAPLAEAAFGPGWYAPEGGAAWRWTDGAATLLLTESARPAHLRLRPAVAGARYWITPPRSLLRRAA
jgi:hypothetical protein